MHAKAKECENERGSQWEWQDQLLLPGVFEPKK